MSSQTIKDPTFGEKAVGLNFNPSGSDEVGQIKKKFADIIDSLHKLRSETSDDAVSRMCSIAITEVQTSQMWAVKAMTWQY